MPFFLQMPQVPGGTIRRAFVLASLCFLNVLAGLVVSAEEKAAAAAPATPAANSTASCLECHSDSTLTMRRQKKDVSIFVDQAKFGQSVHGTLDCVDCHEGFDGESVPHKKPMTAVDCASCHEEKDIAKKHVFHTNFAGKVSPEAAKLACTACHGTHETVKLRSPLAPYAPKQQVASCGKCHQEAHQQFDTSAHGKALASAAPDAPLCLTCHQKPVTNGRELATVELKLAQTQLCESCHVKKSSVAGQTLRGTGFVSSFDQSVHGAALHKGDATAANCVDCHGAHDMNRAIAAGARINKQNQPATCAKCHEKTAAHYADSVHAVALKKGNLDSPVCTDCHGEHAIKAHTDPGAPIHARNVAQQVCATCHASLKLTQKYGLSSKSFQTFADSYHGLAARGGAVEVVNCASCHDTHAIKSHLDPTSTVHKSNLVQTCGQCHPGANTRFAVGSVHVSTDAGRSSGATDRDAAIIQLVANIYVWMIVVVVGGMFIHNALDLFKKVRRKLAIQKGLIEEEHVEHRLYLRMTVHERLQHAVLVISFVLLVVTGFMLRYPEAWWVVAIRNLSAGAFEWRSLIHRIAGVVMLVAGAWHVCYLLFTKPGRSLLRDLLPRWRDVTDPIKVMKYNLGLATTKPEFRASVTSRKPSTGRSSGARCLWARRARSSGSTTPRWASSRSSASTSRA